MPCLDTSVSQSCFRKNLISARVPHLFCGNQIDISSFGQKKKWASTLKLYVHIPTGQTMSSSPRLLVKAIATFEKAITTRSVEVIDKDHDLFPGSTNGSQSFQFSNIDADEIGEREKLRRLRISIANKGNVPWNLGRKHPPETLKRIQERTKLAMQNPKVRMKLLNIGHAQSDETRFKIGVGVRMGWEKRKKKLLVQERCCLLWQNLIAEASRKGLFGEDELQWDSYEILDEQLRKEWLESIEMRRTTPRPKGSRRAPKSPEQRRKISEAISAKWADPEYRDRVCSALAVYHGNTAGIERKPRKKSSGESKRKKSAAEKKSLNDLSSINNSNDISARNKRSKMKSVSFTSYKDPSASSKLEMIKNIRLQRATLENKKREAAERARLLIAEAEKAAKALELAAVTSPLARASLIETRKLIAEATRSLEGIDSRPLNLSVSSSEALSSPESDELLHSTTTNDISSSRVINGTSHLYMSVTDLAESTDKDIELPNLLEFRREPTVTDKQIETIEIGSHKIETNLWNSLPESSEIKLEETLQESSGGSTVEDQPSCNEDDDDDDEKEMNAKSEIASATKTKKTWVRGRLVEVEE